MTIRDAVLLAPPPALRVAGVGPHPAPGAVQLATPSARRSWHLALLVLAVLALPACHAGPPGPLEGKAEDEWKRSYTIADGGEMQLVGGNGAIEVTGGTGRTVEVVARRIARAYDDKMAQDVLPRIQIREDITPDKVVLTSEGLGGIVIGVDIQVNYRVTIPANLRLRARTANGPITVTDLEGRLVANSANGPITVKNLQGGVEARTTNGDVSVDLARFGEDPIDLRTSNGKIDLALAADVSASLLANVTNGAVDVAGLSFEPTGDQSRRRVRGRINGGGLPIEITTVNGSVHVHSRP